MPLSGSAPEEPPAQVDGCEPCRPPTPRVFGGAQAGGWWLAAAELELQGSTWTSGADIEPHVELEGGLRWPRTSIALSGAFSLVPYDELNRLSIDGGWQVVAQGVKFPVDATVGLGIGVLWRTWSPPDGWDVLPYFVPDHVHPHADAAAWLRLGWPRAAPTRLVMSLAAGAALLMHEPQPYDLATVGTATPDFFPHARVAAGVEVQPRSAAR